MADDKKVDDKALEKIDPQGKPKPSASEPKPAELPQTGRFDDGHVK